MASTTAGANPDGAGASVFAPVLDVARAIGGASDRWAVHGGWALDLAAGTRSRHHEDVDVTVDATDASSVLDALARHGAEVAWVIAEGARLAQAPRRPAEPRPAGAHQARVRLGGVRVDVVLEPWAPGAWRYRRDPRIGLPLERAVRHLAVEGVALPVLAPEAVLLVKAGRDGWATPRSKDDADLALALPSLDAQTRAWLRDALPAGHPWRARLAPATL